MSAVSAALGRWLAERADPRDQVTIVTSSGEAWWSDVVGGGRADIEAVLRRLKGTRTLALERVSPRGAVVIERR
jgi:aryl-alcohol dehydrogenase-like predicted oxidoreductase